ncbi:hypothetical protein A3A70_03235 [candidate division WWE3 bacterium RIFCSPLOWO2_01_FULL_42_11]|uniref:DUF2292 domain-containing protein n=1 Tax=candidate division WWE3 bacterium RIFCSPLOWO2_01_FULL_42_11 TaxID=1802627 RepID=A0A1F4VM84_UNCKA|nr:MAG: hypothetical protein A3A70_03235 [candidate division WWE3 bacterium RIFCSPLOWO2_01_FULL_42_11]
MVEYSTKQISPILLEELKEALKSVSPYGSVEIQVQDSLVIQITVRNIKKTLPMQAPRRVLKNTTGN